MFHKSFLQQNTEIARSILSYTPADWILVRWSQGSESSQIHMPTCLALKCQLGIWRHKTRPVRVTFQQAAGLLRSMEFTVALFFLLNNIEESISQHAALTSGAVLFNWVFIVIWTHGVILLWFTHYRQQTIRHDYRDNHLPTVTHAYIIFVSEN